MSYLAHSAWIFSLESREMLNQGLQKFNLKNIINLINGDIQYMKYEKFGKKELLFSKFSKLVSFAQSQAHIQGFSFRLFLFPEH